MHRIDGPTAAPGGLWTEGDPVGGVPATIVSDYWMNDTQENLIALLTAASITPIKNDFTQITAAVRKVAAGRLLRTSVYTHIAGVQNVSVNGGAFTPTGATTFSTLPATTKTIAEGCGGGGGSGAITATGAANFSVTGGGAGGSYGMGEYAGAIVAAAVTIGAAGTAGVAPGGAGGNGGTTSLGALLSISGGSASTGAGALTGNSTFGGAQPTKTVTGANVTSSIGGYGTYGISLTQFIGGQGGGSYFGPGGAPAIAGGGSAVGVPAQTPGGGGGGSAAGPSAPAQNGAAGAAGILIIREYA